MAKRPTINTLANTASPTYLTQLNQNFTNVQTQFDNTLSLDGSTPNAMNADIDLNGNDLINASGVYTDRLFLNGESITSLTGVAFGSVAYADSFGLVGDDSTDDAAAFNAAMSYLESRGGGEFHFNGSKTYRMTAVTQASNTRVYLNGATVKVHPSTPKTGNWWTNRNINALSGDRTCNDTHIIGPGTLDGSLRPFDRWLSTSSGTPITDPEADYVAGTGALASGITGVSLTAVLTSDVVTSVTVNTGGSGWNGHPTFPYIPTTVPLKFTGGGGSGAKAFATISGGTLISVTMEEGGSGYTSPPTVTTMGGYADIALLVQPSVNRRNAAYNDAGNGVAFQKVNRPVVVDVLFTGFRCRALADVGCKDAKFIRCAFEDCGKNDGPFHAIWTQSSGNPTVPPVFYAPSENTLIDACVFNNLERSAIQMAPAKGGVVRNCRMDNCGESTIYINTNANYDGGMIVIEGNTFVGGYVTDIVSYHIEAQATKNLIIRDNDFTGSSEGVLALGGCQNTRVFGNRFEDCSTGASTLAGFIPYGPFSERYGFNAGTRSIAGTANLSNTQSLIEVGIIDTVPQAATEFANNVFIETRGVASHARSIFAQVKSGGVSSIAGSTSIHDNDVTQVPATLPFYTTPVGTVWTANMPLSIRNNPGHVSEAPVILEQAITTTGVLTFTPGFRPSMVVLEAVTTNNTLFRYGTGRIVWKRDAIRNDYSMILATDGTNHRALTIGTEAVRLVDTAGTTILSVEFVSWQELGFTLNVVTRTTNCTLKMVCIP